MTDNQIPAPAEIFSRAVEEGDRRLDQPLLELVSTSFIAGFTVVFGIVALAMVEAMVEPLGDDLGRLAGALAFGLGIVFLVVGRVELFNENFFDPVAALFESADRWSVASLGRLWVVTLVFNLVGGVLFALVFAVEGVLPPESTTVLATFATESATRTAMDGFASAITGGALVSLLSFLLAGSTRVESQITLAYVVGFLLALGPFDHVVVTALHLFLGVLFGAPVEYATFGRILVVVTAGNFVGGLGLVTFTHITQAIGAGQSSE
jgi:formate/nitrite transporter FocA (FNT family)